ncbi:hypothetical protein DSAG12_02334 [Promethearchaeum syntrophicum]|uniref:Uncharacterized protein n=1 Tax=Promethearchaeum syntrophicum TaxID=2594042 RepID=A0A5B9DBI8_9ARCH|nr:hypothetical protein [Candidatus Prometheoarchaeum syntrophicum]
MDLMIILKTQSGSYQPQFTATDINLPSLPLKNIKKAFFRLYGKYVIRDDEEHTKLVKRNQRINSILIGFTILSLLAYIPMIYFSPQLGYDFTNTDQMQGVFGVKMFVEMFIFCLLAVWKGDHITKQLWKRKEVLTAAYHHFLRKSVGIKNVDVGTIKHPGKGVTFEDELELPQTFNGTTTFSSKVEVRFFHQLAKYLIYRYENFKDIVIYSIFLGFQVFFLVFLFDLDTSGGLLVLIGLELLFYILGIGFAISQARVNYVRLPKQVLGSKTLTWDQNAQAEQAMMTFVRHMDIYDDSGSDVDLIIASESIDKIKEIEDE